MMLPNEVDKLRAKEQKERKACYFIYYRVMVVCCVLPFFGAWYSVLAGAANAFSIVRYFSVTGILLLICTLVISGAYFIMCGGMRRDIKKQLKTIATMPILKKRYVVNNDSYFFFIGSPIRLYIEVTQFDYQTRQEGDEISIEYATRSREYLGYF